MTWEDVLAEAVKMDREEIKARLLPLIGTPQFPALVALALMDEREATGVVASYGQASDHGKLAFGAGALWQTKAATERLRGLMAKGKLSP